MIIDNIKKAIDLITDKTFPVIKKVMVLLVVFVILFAIEFLAKVTYNYHLNNKLKQLDYIARIKLNSPSDSVAVYLDQLEVDILKKSHYSEGLHNAYLSLSDKITQIRIEPTQQKNNTTEKLSTFLVLLFLFGLPISLVFYSTIKIFRAKPFKFKKAILPTIFSFAFITFLFFLSNYLSKNIFFYSKGVSYLILFICQSIISLLILNPPKED